ncbi:hypothetical protein L6452_21533 [Arctium lappa]|uniref:Uncharacterized protein n=1 Tax=Arctium lappa TaxID=4217 RepID=A0ACB9AXB4_ARCLA|nr:hypothetical protein L6452_21533 [Arctium lappa]
MSMDNQLFTIEEELAVQSITIKNALSSENRASSAFVLPLSNVHSKTLSLVIQFLHKQASVAEDDLKIKFVEELDISTLLDLLNAASYLHIKSLLDVVCEKLADLIMDKPVEEVREIFKMRNDYTSEEEKSLRESYAWAFEIDSFAQNPDSKAGKINYG